MDDKALKYISEHLENVIDKKVNGKIDDLDKKFDKRFTEHEKKMSPIYDAYTSANNTGKFLIWLSKVVLAISVIIGIIVTTVRYIK